MGLNRRDVLLVVVIWAVVAVLGVGAYLAVRTAPDVPALPITAFSATPTSATIYTPAPAEQTAQTLYATAEAAARGWRTDARLVSCRGSWEQTAINLVGRPVEWSYRFYSPGSERLYFVLVTPSGHLQTIQHVRKLAQSPPPISLEAWQIDSTAALANWLNTGGGLFLGSHPGSTVTAQLSTRSHAAEPQWTVVGYDRSTDKTLAVMVDAATGQTSVLGGQ